MTTTTPPVSDEAVRDVIRRMNIRQIWKDNGGGFHGPHIEHAYIEDRKFDAVISAIVIAVLSHAAAPFMRGDGEDKARLDFLDEMNRRLNARYGTHYSWKLILNHNVNRLMLNDMAVDLQDAEPNGLPSCRDAIDAERSRIVASRAAALAAQDAQKENADGK